MTENEVLIKTPEAIETIKSNMPTSGYYMLRESLAMAIEALEKVQHYQEMDKKLREVFGDCDGLLETVVDSLCRHEGEDIGSPVKSRLLTDETVDKWDAYLAIGTVEECQEAVEKQKAKKPKKILRHRGGFETHHCTHCDMDYQVDKRYEITDLYCPVCGKLLDSGFNNYCANCGQAILY